MTTFPTSLDSFSNPSAGTPMNDTAHKHDEQHANLNDAVLALQVKVGINGSSDPNSLTYKVANMAAVKQVYSYTGAAPAAPPNDPTREAIAYKADGSGPIFVWDKGPGQAWNPN
jgi:hypothetical protein